MDANNKTHAKDYLLEFIAKSTTPHWLGLLIQKCIEVNGKFSDEEKDRIFTQLLQENKLESSDQSQLSEGNKSSESQIENISTPNQQQLVLKKITHIKGVNALIPNQSITFSPACTIIFGLNGTGKSGYFRIIHELAGGAKHKSILNNIHGQENGLEVKVEFSLDGTTQSYKWQDKYKRGITPFNKVQVFDSDYLPIFLNERESSVNIEPLGLNLFHTIASVMDEFKVQLEGLQQEQENGKPDLQPLFDLLHSQDLKLLLQQDTLSDSDKQLLKSNSFITKEELANITKLKQQKRDLEKQNTDDSKKVLGQEIIEIDSLKNHLTRIKSSLESLTKQVAEAITDYSDKKKARDERAKQFELIRNVPSHESEEWQSFIKAANEYGIKLDQRTFKTDEKCLYCHQPLNAEAITLVKTYTEYLSDQSQNNLNTSANNVAILLRTHGNLHTSFNITENLKTILTEKKTEQDQDIYELVNQILAEVEKQKTSLAEVLEKKNHISDAFVLDLLKVDAVLLDLSSQRLQRINDLGQSETKKKETITKLEDEIKTLEDKENITKWKTKIETYFTKVSKGKKYETVLRTINTRGVTELGSKAQDSFCLSYILPVLSFDSRSAV